MTYENIMVATEFNQTLKQPKHLNNNDFKRIKSDKKEKDFKEIKMWQVGTIILYDKIVAKQVIKKKILHYNEGQLVKLLDEKKIGRPSTFSSFVQKIQDREYVQKRNYESPPVELCQWILKKDNS